MTIITTSISERCIKTLRSQFFDVQTYSFKYQLSVLAATLSPDRTASATAH